MFPPGDIDTSEGVPITEGPGTPHYTTPHHTTPPLPTAHRQCGSVQKDLSGPSAGLITARPGPRGTKAWDQRELRRHHQAERQTALCPRCATALPACIFPRARLSQPLPFGNSTFGRPHHTISAEVSEQSHALVPKFSLILPSKPGSKSIHRTSVMTDLLGEAGEATLPPPPPT